MIGLNVHGFILNFNPLKNMIAQIFSFFQFKIACNSILILNPCFFHNNLKFDLCNLFHIKISNFKLLNIVSI